MSNHSVSHARVVVLVSPTARRGIGDELAAAAGAAGIELDLAVIRGGSGVDLIGAGKRELDRGLDALVVQGGDGMVQLGVGLVAETDVPLGIIPSGTGNDFARAVGIPRGGRTGDAVAALVAALVHPRASHRRVDAMRVRTATGERWAVNSVNIGFDALVNERANAMRHLRGTTRYLAAIVLVTRQFTTIPLRIGFDGGPMMDAPGPLVTVGNGSSVGGGIRLLPGADVADGRLDVMLVSPVNRWQLATLFPLAAAGMHRWLPQVTTRRASRVRVEAAPDTRVYADGEPLGAGGADIECVPDAWVLLRGPAGRDLR